MWSEVAQRWQTVRVFIFSTFRDMPFDTAQGRQAERDWLVKVVFPKLRRGWRNSAFTSWTLTCAGGPVLIGEPGIGKSAIVAWLALTRSDVGLVAIR